MLKWIFTLLRALNLERLVFHICAVHLYLVAYLASIITGENVDRSSWENSDASTAAVNIVKASPLWIKDDDLSSERVIGGFSKKEISRKMQWTEAEDQIIIYCKATVRIS